MARCYFCGKTTSFGNNVSHAGNRTSRKFRANIKRVSAIVKGRKRKIQVCTTCIKMGRHLGLELSPKYMAD